ncbi:MULTISPECIES: DUF6913 domain-containing protein [unclassified Flavobacterium]|uniref:DUF6913 domain-containing protein n=1 Tax=unclassified Flavobacterium TaxID=196869 RepID=UPI003F8DAF56
MFLSVIKDFSVKKILKNSLQNVKSSAVSGTVKTVGLLVDQSYFSETQLLIQDLIDKGILKEDITVLVYKDKFKKNRSALRASFSSKHLKWNSEINSPTVNDFMNQEFDLLISYYDVEKAILLVVTHGSKALFKVGFAAIDKRLNDLMINTNAENHKVFTHELFRYLKILNKI